MIKKLIFYCLLALPLMAEAQVTVSIQLPAAGMVTKDQLWNLALVNNGNAAETVSISLSLQDAVSGQPVLSATTRSFLLNKGMKLLSVQDVQPVQYNYGSMAFNNTLLPLGSYIACYQVNSIDSKEHPVLAEECVRLNIIPLSPPLLTSPADKSVITTAYPQFTWMPPTPVTMFDDLSYDLSVAEVLPGQSAPEAILYNAPLYVRGMLRVTTDNYPASYSQLEAGKTYVWQVTAKNGVNYAATTEAFTFSLPTDTAKADTVNAAYIVLTGKTAASGINYLNESNLYLKYYSFDPAFEAVIRFTGRNGAIVEERKLRVIYGDNFLKLRLGNKYQKGETYQLEITDLKNNHHSIAFSIK
ncbi:hypothetical protein [Flavihumibacter petaseus]|uniref:Fibronectin type-III domain-containing protein n=1 Tax=Flavihumibacter petaseus NBRC 106054 TaxID=1220578 RepID=A0A0E9N406_9BACT|nr:hypothetical protein [Flavihumibacter petaseus]GAO44100.1 hypothetical protein FPE01S_03_01390 [Flavihumibacter petaseus NBRC 106054]